VDKVVADLAEERDRVEDKLVVTGDLPEMWNAEMPGDKIRRGNRVSNRNTPSTRYVLRGAGDNHRGQALVLGLPFLGEVPAGSEATFTGNPLGNSDKQCLEVLGALNNVLLLDDVDQAALREISPTG